MRHRLTDCWSSSTFRKLLAPRVLVVLLPAPHAHAHARRRTEKRVQNKYAHAASKTSQYPITAPNVRAAHSTEFRPPNRTMALEFFLFWEEASCLDRQFPALENCWLVAKNCPVGSAII
ncbi:hypothetical protein J3459_008443 [Metarhizium acridum]|uniref:uncharacterized protein n=1 Tax=Metarhizium acridum TaxID=92637 RepID=UPI001C6C2376|nr:hypothetical protein J3458_000413 [Metarhizium acridum]KAG8426099.1 hypothetical protein J3459_008443 [Metarhizium acridum]